MKILAFFARLWLCIVCLCVSMVAGLFLFTMAYAMWIDSPSFVITHSCIVLLFISSMLALFVIERSKNGKDC